MLRQVSQRSRLEAQNPYIGLTGAIRDERQRLSIWRENPLIVEAGDRGQLLAARTIEAGSIDISRPVSLGGEDDPLAVSRKRRVVIARGRRLDRLCAAAVSRGDEDVGVEGGEARERDGIRRYRLSSGRCHLSRARSCRD